MPISDYIDDLSSSKGSVSYLDSSPRRQVQLPLGISWYTGSGTTDPNDLYTDDPSLYFVYSGGWHQTAITSQVRDRYNGVTITLLEGGPIQLYVQAADSVFSFVQNFYGAPYTTSGDAGSEELILSTYYPTTPVDPESLAVEVPSPGTYKVVFPHATDSQAFVVSHSGVGSYRVSQIIPRRAVQAYDIDVNSIKAYHVTAELIDTISLRVSDSIVVGPELIGAKSIDGSKIVDGTISGILMRDGTVTGNKILAGTISGVLIAGNTITGNNIVASTISGALIAAGTITANNITTRTITADKIVLSGITADLLGPEAVTAAALASGAVISGKLAANSILANNVTAGVIQGYHVAANTISADKLQVVQLDAIAANMGTLTVNSGITIGTAGYLWAGAGSASAPTTGLKIYTSNGISRLTTFSGGISQIDIGSDGKLYAGSGQSLKLDSTGMTLKTAVSGVFVPNSRTGQPEILTTAFPPKENLIKFHPYIIQTSYGVPTFYQDTSDSVLAFLESTQLYNTRSNIATSSYTGVKTRFRSGWLPTESGLTSAFTGLTDSIMSVESNAAAYASLNLSAGTDYARAIISLSGHALNYSTINAHATYININPASDLYVTNSSASTNIAGRTTVNNTLTAGATTISGTLNVASDFKVNTNKFTVAPATGNTVVAGTLNITGAASASNLSGTNTGDQTLPVYGDGADGAVTFDGSSAYSFATYSSTIYTLTRDVWATTVSVSSGYTVITAGYRLFAQNEISNYGAIHNNGSSGAGTTAGAGGLGGFFKAGGAGAVGLLAASAGAAGNAQATPTANTWVGGIGGRGGQGRLNNIGFNGGQITSANVTTPANADGGSKVTSNYVNYLTRYVVGATNWQMTPSIGGGGGAKSVTGTAATSGGGGGGGGICFVAAPIITGNGVISANGGSGGNAAGTGGSFGGGGGGGGGVVCVIAKTSAITPTATGGTGGTSIFGANGTQPVAHAFGTNTTATQTLTLTPVHPLSKGKLYLITVHLNVAAGLGGSGINSITGYGINWTNLTGSRVEYSTIAAPTRVQETWYGSYTGTEPDLIESGDIVINLSNINTAARVIMDEISGVELSTAVTSNIAINATNSAMTLTVTLPNVPVAGNMVYSVFTRSAGAATAAGAGNVLVNSQVTAPQISSQVSSAQQANTQTHTTNFATMGAFSVELTASIAGASGSDGWAGKVIRVYG